MDAKGRCASGVEAVQRARMRFGPATTVRQGFHKKSTLISLPLAAVFACSKIVRSEPFSLFQNLTGTGTMHAL